jgi:GGDEF domain-containing protein
VARPITVGPGHEIALSTSIGTATNTGVGVTATDLLRRADTAMYRAKAPEPAATATGGRPRSTPPSATSGCWPTTSCRH